MTTFGRRGSILVGLLWVVALLALVVVGVLVTARLDLLTGKNFTDKIQARYLALAGIEKAKALLYQDAQDRSHAGKNFTGNLADSPGDFRDVEFGRGTFSVLRRGRPDEGGRVIYGVADEASRLNVNVAEPEALKKIKGMSSDIVAAINGWRGQGDKDAETEFYLGQRPPGHPRFSALETDRELLMIRGVTPELFYGQDRHGDGALEADDREGAAAKPPEYSATMDTGDLGWSAVLTVNSQVKNVTAGGDARVNIQTADETALQALPGVTQPIAHAIVSYRNQNRFQSIVDLLEVTPPQDQQSGLPNGSAGPGGGPVVSPDLLETIADRITTVEDRTLPGVINLNTAGVEVLATLPGVDADLAQAIITYRRSLGYFNSPADLLKVDGMTPQILKRVEPLVTARSETFRILAEGRVKAGGARQRVQEIVRVNLDGVKVLSYREDDL